ncbi:MAG TPA: TolC family protein [Longimicrobiales bacterium]|nr:TolC family protein [Longimicrobiales bacterium]
MTDPSPRAGGRSSVPALLLVLATAAPMGAQEAAAPLPLREVLTRTLETHPDAATAAAVVETARARRSAAGAERFPALGASGHVSRFEEPMVVAPFHGFDLGAPPPFDRTLVQASLALRYTLFDGGARGARVRAAEAGVDAAGAGADASRARLLERGIEAYLETSAARAAVGALLAWEEAMEAERDRARRLLEEGREPRLVLLRAEAALARARGEREAAQARREIAGAELARLADLDAREVRDRPLESVEIAEPAPGEPEPEHPELRRLEREAAAAEARARQARAGWLPTLEATAGFNEYGSGGGDFQGEWQSALRLSYPLFTGGARGAGVAEAEAAGRRAREALRGARLALEGAADRARAAAVEADARIRALRAAEERQAEVVRIEALALEVGSGVQTDYLEAAATLARIRSDLAGARRDRGASRAARARALGRLTLSWIDENVEVQP